MVLLNIIIVCSDSDYYLNVVFILLSIISNMMLMKIMVRENEWIWVRVVIPVIGNVGNGMNINFYRQLSNGN